mgnify:CR=1 FL=1
MTESVVQSHISFYFLSSQPVAKVVPRLLEKALEKSRNICVRLPDQSDIDSLSQALWVYRSLGFLPHGIEGDGTDPCRHPLWLTDAKSSHKADIHMWVNCYPSDAWNAWGERTFLCFDQVSKAKDLGAQGLWKRLSTDNVRLDGWLHDDVHGWKATSEFPT